MAQRGDAAGAGERSTLHRRHGTLAAFCACVMSASIPCTAPSQLMIPAEAAHDTMEALGEVGLLQFKDMNPEKSAFQRTYANQVGTLSRRSTTAARIVTRSTSAGR